MKRKSIRIIIAAFLFGICAVVFNYCVIPRLGETALRDDLRTIRRVIDQYAIDNRQLPQSLDEIVKAGYIREIPTDAITGKKDWSVEVGEGEISDTRTWGVIDVHSKAVGEGSDGIRYAVY